ncbi:uncharacterized protein LOC118220818 isoform X4 [Anguilla anguilla]|uniref:uncharacterized protein LOC118220818 isoform X4 n=1 Tax=Anguilla anguilla TaxID=7936 RepID=UPI0015A98875|nr:uncharacterized protein LOC118220818 isoform X4 [Anguilla anguilla]
MISLFIVLLIILKYQTADPIVFKDIGQSVTIHSRVKEITLYDTSVSWYRLRPSGKMEQITNLYPYKLKDGRYSGELPVNSKDTHLNVSSATIGDSGRSFAAVLSENNLKLGSSKVVAVIDPKSLPAMCVFLGCTGTILCELKGGGPHWSDPQWETDDAKDGLTLSEAKAKTFVDEHGAFIQSSILSLKDRIRGLNCVCRHSTGVIIRTRVMQDNATSVQGSVPASGKDQCQLLLYLSPLAVVLLLVTVTASGLWACRRRK